MLGIDEMREAFEAFGQLLNDLSLVTVGTTWSVNDLNLHSQRRSFNANDRLKRILPRR